MPLVYSTTYFSNPVSIKFQQTVSVNPRLRAPLFSNNSMVFYKRSSLASGGVSTVRNSSAKSKRV